MLVGWEAVAEREEQLVATTTRAKVYTVFARDARVDRSQRTSRTTQPGSNIFDIETLKEQVTEEPPEDLALHPGSSKAVLLS
ncbi:hypothetical protein M419DRAFT_118169 [Trichoderma reesei RUT C-30]|jgi:hypothetical protein|uniref:Uncharacterized protein n=1 Tax=Hypocrea jecorina (strain ATCC 56765 / BCRC 32924 / NRRL 11460 / Rut C-30) TaxID=1344414 RepID=A0A024SFV4_HYPJR|nr:hypothetical protein M419DRAFT_118169 [Trichoderma reesei RUT C-30]